MRGFEYVNLIIRLLGRSKRHTLHAMSGHALIISIIISTLGIVSGFSSAIYGLTEQAGQSNRFMIRARNDNLTIDLYNKLKTDTRLTVIPIAKTSIRFATDKYNITAFMIGTDVSDLIELLHASYISGSNPIYNKTPIECLICQDLFSAPLNSNITITQLKESNEITFVIKGILDGMNEFQETIIINIGDFISLTNITFLSEIKVKTDKLYSLIEFTRILEFLMEEDLMKFNIWNEQQADTFTDTIITDILVRLNLFFIILFIIALIRIFHSILWYVLTYEQFFLILRSLGSSKYLIFIFMIVLSQVIGIAGFILGILIGIVFSPIVVSLISLFLSSTFFPTPFAVLDLFFLFWFSEIITLIASIAPSHKISSTPPSKISMLIKIK